MNEYGYVKVGASTLELKVSDTIYNVQMIKKQIDEAVNKNIQIISFPELSITGYTCGDLFNQDILIDKSYEGLKDLVDYSKDKMIVIIVGSPIKCENKLYNCAVVINNGKILGIVPKTYIPNYNEFYEMRWFKSSNDLKIKEINLFNEFVPIGVDLIFTSKLDDELKFGVEICEDVWSLYPKSNDYASSGASIIFNLSASNETIGKYDFRKELIKMQSIKTISGYVYSSSGINESSTDLLFSGSSLIYENGKLLSENNRFDFNSNLIYSDVDIKRLVNDRRKNTSFISNTDKEYRNIYFTTSKNNLISRKYSKYPFVPSNEDKREERCKEIINIQSSALAKRLKHTNIQKCVIGVSGGLDSTLAFLVIKKAFEKLKIDNKNIIAVTMPGFGTTNRTYENALDLIKINNATLKEIDIKKACLVHYSDIDQDINNHDITYENAQARERTKILMDIANKENALVIGTGDLSELALGWCTYNGDHMSMYAVNIGVPKTLIRHLVNWYMKKEDEKKKLILTDILETPISPELLPPDKDGNIAQKTENSIGSYILHDFFLYHFLRYGTSPKKLYYLAKLTFPEYNKEEIIKCLKIFINRFFTQQFKRNCLPDGVKVGSISLSPRGDLRLPSDLNYQSYLDEIEKIESSEKYE